MIKNLCRQSGWAVFDGICLLLLIGCAPLSDRGEAVPLNHRPTPHTEMRFANTVRQMLDFSCGAASIATIMTFYFERHTTENDVLNALRVTYDGDFSQTQEDGFSLTDLIHASEYLGYSAEAVAIAANELSRLNGPVIVHLDKDVVQHFVVLRHMSSDVAYISDPIAGDTAMPVHQFVEQYTGNALAIWLEGEELPNFSRLMSVGPKISVSNTTSAALGGGPSRFYPLF